MTATPETARDDLPARAAYAAHYHLNPEEAAAEWPFTPDREREHEHWRTVARAAVAAYIEATGRDPSIALYLSAIARLSAGLRDVQHACERGDSSHAVAPVAAAALADAYKLQLPHHAPALAAEVREETEDAP